jgi:hypothetical protein
VSLTRQALPVLLVSCALAAGCSARADEGRVICGLMRQEADTAFRFRDVNGRMEVASRRPLQEQDALGRAALKGALARELQNQLGASSVRWSGAAFRGPYKCASYKVIVMAVDPLTFKVGDTE